MDSTARRYLLAHGIENPTNVRYYPFSGIIMYDLNAVEGILFQLGVSDAAESSTDPEFHSLKMLAWRVQHAPLLHVTVVERDGITYLASTAHYTIHPRFAASVVTPGISHLSNDYLRYSHLIIYLLELADGAIEKFARHLAYPAFEHLQTYEIQGAGDASDLHVLLAERGARSLFFAGPSPGD